MVIVSIPLLSAWGTSLPWGPRNHCLVQRSHCKCLPFNKEALKKMREQYENEKSQENFKLRVDAQRFTPDEIAIKVEGDKLKVTGKHHKETDYGFESAEFERSYPIPADVDPQSFASKLNDDGVLEIIASKVKPPASKETQQNEENFKLTFDVSDYKPDEITVKLQGNKLSIRGEQKSDREGDKDSFFHHRQFSHRLLLPNTIKLDSLQSKLTKEGKLVIEAEKMGVVEPAVRQLEIEQEGASNKDDGSNDESNNATDIANEE